MKVGDLVYMTQKFDLTDPQLKNVQGQWPVVGHVYHVSSIKPSVNNPFQDTVELEEIDPRIIYKDTTTGLNLTGRMSFPTTCFRVVEKPNLWGLKKLMEGPFSLDLIMQEEEAKRSDPTGKESTK